MNAEYKRQLKNCFAALRISGCTSRQYGTIFFLLSVQVNCGFGKSTMKF